MAKKRNVKLNKGLIRGARAMQYRIYFVLGCLSLLFVSLIYRLYILTVVDSEKLINIQDSQITVEREVILPRGDILDREGKPLAKDAPLVKIVVDAKLFHSDYCIFGAEKCSKTLTTQERDKRLEREREKMSLVAQDLSMTFDELKNFVSHNKSTHYKVLAKGLPPEIVSQSVKLRDLDPYIKTYYYFRRFYPMKEATASVIGLVNSDGKGISGLEKSFESILKSKPGLVNEKYSGEVGLKKTLGLGAQRHIFASEQVVEAKRGESIRLSIDSYIQHVSFQTLVTHAPEFSAVSGSAIVVDIQTGELIALADYPSTNPNDRENVSYEYSVSKAMANTLEPGSAIKPIVMAGLLEAGLVKNKETIDTNPGQIYIDKWLVKDFKNYKYLTPAGIIQKSSNVGMVKLTERIDGESLSYFLSSMGLNEPSGVFPGLEAIGNLGNAWESDVTKLNQSYGYGLEVSLLSLARAYVAIARYGEMIPLTILKGQSPAAKQQVLSPEVAQTVLEWMQLVTHEEGTGTKGALDEVHVAAKTGTARARNFKTEIREVYNNIYSGIFPANNPKYLVIVAYQGVKEPYHYAGNSSALSFKTIASEIIRNKGV